MKIEDTEMAGMRAGPKIAGKLEGQLKAVEGELENEQRRQADSAKGLAKAERRARELQFQVIGRQMANSLSAKFVGRGGAQELR